MNYEGNYCVNKGDLLLKGCLLEGGCLCFLFRTDLTCEEFIIELASSSKQQRCKGCTFLVLGRRRK